MAGSRGNITGEKEKEEGRRHDRCNRQKTKTGKLKNVFIIFFSIRATYLPRGDF
jgi:hypothetical protein